MLRTSLTAFIALTLISGTAQASPYAGAVKIAAAPGYATPGEPAPVEAAPTPAPQPYEAQPAPQPYAQPQPYGAEPQPYAQPQPYGPQTQPYQEPQKPRRRGKGLMIAGWTMFGASYLSTVLVGAVLYDASKLCDSVGGDCRRTGAGLFVPVVGPLIEVGRAESNTATGTIFAVFATLVQAAGLSMGIAGTVLFVRDGKARQAQQQVGLHLGRGVRLRAVPRLDGATLNLSYRF